MFKEVEINSQEDLALYLINTGDLYIHDKLGRIFFDRDESAKSPFKYKGQNGDVSPMDGVWNNTTVAYYKKAEWFESIPEGKRVPCYVSDISPLKKDAVSYIARYDATKPQPYRSLSDTPWTYATPIPADELWIPE